MNALEHKYTSDLNSKVSSMSAVHSEQIAFLQEKIDNVFYFYYFFLLKIAYQSSQEY